MKKIFFASLFFAAGAFLFAEVTVVNPVPGSYANAQSLVIEANGGEEVYYSFSGSDPLSQGFAYDGPVVLDVTGNVELRVAIVGQDQSRTEKKVLFFVEPRESQNQETASFLKSFETGPCFDYAAGEKIAVPFSLNYSFFEGGRFEKGKEISISKKATMERYVPMNISDGESVWRYVLHVIPAEPGVLTKRDVPFKIQDWTKVVFLDPKCIYSLDGDWWQGGGKIAEIDRSAPAEIFWQSAEFSPENPVSKIVLPPKPVLKAERGFDGSVAVSAHGGSGYSLSASPLSKTKLISDGLHETLVIDVFPGDKIDEALAVDVYSDRVFQGTLFVDVYANRSAPAAPRVVSSAVSAYSRDDVQVSARSAPKLKTFYSVSNPISVEPSFSPPDLDALAFDKGQFDEYQGQSISLFGDTEKILAYKVSFYSEDESGSRSALSDYSVIIDKYNYYVDADSQSAEPDGSPFAPFKDLSRLPKIAGSNSFSRFYLSGSVSLPPGEIALSSNVEFEGIGDARIVVPANSVLILKNAGLYAQNIFWQKADPPASSKKLRAAAKALTNLFVLERSAATFKNCQIEARFSGDGRAFNCSSSALELEAVGVTSEAQGYACAISSSGQSKVRVKNSRLLCIADSAVIVSAAGGSLSLSNNFAQVTARTGRCAEFIDATVELLDNKFISDIQTKTDGYRPLYLSGKTEFLENKRNLYK